MKQMIRVVGVCVLLSSSLLATEYCEPLFYLRAETGPSFSGKADIKVDLSIWDPAVEGYNSTLGVTPFVMGSFGVYINDWLSTGVSIAHRSKFSYRKKQTALPVASTPGPLANKTRFFNLDTINFMFDVYANRSANSCFTYHVCGVTLIPYVGASIGWSENILYDFHSKLDEEILISGVAFDTVASIMTPSTKNAFAWQVQLGLDATVCGIVTLGLAYRYFDGGKFVSNDYVIDVIPGTLRPVVVPAWTGKLRAHELVGSFAIAF